MSQPTKEFTLFVTETISRDIEYVVYGTSEEDAREAFERGEIVDSWNVSEDIQDVLIHDVQEYTEED